MYYEEKAIDGILCCRTTPDGKWTQFTARELTEKLLASHVEVLKNFNGWAGALTCLREITTTALRHLQDRKRK